MDRRHEFLVEFLGALGAREIRHLSLTADSVSGTAVYEPDDADEQQDFRWDIPESAAPTPAVLRLAALINRDGLLSIDKLVVSRKELLARFNADQGAAHSPEQFTAILGELLQIEVPMLDDGVESDCFFIHE